MGKRLLNAEASAGGKLGLHRRWHVGRGVVKRGCQWCDDPAAGSLTPNQVIAAFWALADNEECDGVAFEACSDQWWRVVATCRHGSYGGVSNGPLDVSRAFERALTRFREQHATIADPEG